MFRRKSDSRNWNARIILEDPSGRVVSSEVVTFNSGNVEELGHRFIENAKAALQKNESQVSFDSFDLQHKTKSSTPILPARPNDGSGDLFTSGSSGGQCTDDMDTQPPAPLYMDPALMRQMEEQALVEVSEESGDEDSERNTESSCGTIFNSLGVEHGRCEKVFGDVQQCTPTDPVSPPPEIFKDIKFVLSCEVDEEGIVGFKKDYYTKLLVAGGGMVYDEIPHDVKNTVLISNIHCTSYKFLRALLLGIPCVKHTWVDDCVRNNDYSGCRIDRIERPLYLLRGVDLLTRDIVRQNKDQLAPPKPFSKQVVYLQGTKKFKDAWVTLVECGGGEGMKRWFRNCTSELSQPTIVASDESSKPSTTTVSFHVPIVRKNWLLQCVITGKLADPAPFLLDLN